MGIVYRVEDKHKKGPYQSQALKRLIKNYREDQFHMDVHHPLMCYDFPGEYTLEERSQYKCCFRTRKQLYEWFEQEILQLLLENGFNIMKIEVKAALSSKSNKQCFFKEQSVKNRYLYNKLKIK